MKRIVKSSKEHWGLVIGEVFVVAGAVIVGEYALRVVGMNALSLLIAIPAIFIGLAVRSYFNGFSKK